MGGKRGGMKMLLLGTAWAGPVAISRQGPTVVEETVSCPECRCKMEILVMEMSVRTTRMGAYCFESDRCMRRVEVWKSILPVSPA